MAANSSTQRTTWIIIAIVVVLVAIGWGTNWYGLGSKPATTEAPAPTTTEPSTTGQTGTGTTTTEPTTTEPTTTEPSTGTGTTTGQ